MWSLEVDGLVVIDDGVPVAGLLLWLGVVQLRSILRIYALRSDWHNKRYQCMVCSKENLNAGATDKSVQKYVENGFL